MGCADGARTALTAAQDERRVIQLLADGAEMGLLCTRWHGLEDLEDGSYCPGQ